MSKLNLFRSANKVTMVLSVFGDGGGVCKIVLMMMMMMIVGGCDCNEGLVVVIFVFLFVHFCEQ